MIIYKIENKINGKIYIGQTKNALNNRVRSHLRNGSFIGNALRKYGLQSFDISVIDEANTKAILNEKEQYWIKNFNSSVPNGYNILQGGSYGVGFSGRHHTEETKKKIQATSSGANNGMFGKHHSEETRKKIGNAENGFRHSEESKKKMSVAHKGAHWVMSEKGKEGLRNRKYSEEGKAKIKEAANRPERIAKLKNAWILRKEKMKELGLTRVSQSLKIAV